MESLTNEAMSFIPLVMETDIFIRMAFSRSLLRLGELILHGGRTFMILGLIEADT